MTGEDCHHLLDSLSEFVDGTLGPEICAEIEKHMAGCDNCKVVVDSLRKTIYLYHVTAGPATMPEDVHQRLFKRLDLEDFLEKEDRVK